MRANAVRFLDRDVAALWPGDARGRRLPLGRSCVGRREATASGTDPADGAFDTQYWTANVNPTDRYVLSLPGSSAIVSPRWT